MQKIVQHRGARIDGNVCLVLDFGIEACQPARRVSKETEPCLGKVLQYGDVESFQQMAVQRVLCG